MEKKEKDEEKAGEQQQTPEGAVSDFENDGWTEQSDGEVVKLEPGDSITGLLIEKNVSHKYNECGIYKIEVDKDPTPKVILGGKQLDRKMATVEEGTNVKIFFVGKEPTEKGQQMNVYKVFTK